jgi:hypothetical protein
VTAGALENHWRRAIPWLWLAMSLFWAVVIIVTDQLARPLALWIATTVGPLTCLATSKHHLEPPGSNTKGTNE